jgi:acetyl/propionyl-CoA carboxylase alpha subunit
MMLALDSYVVHGVETSIDLHKRILAHPAFLKGDTFTDFIEAYGDDLLAPADGVPDEAFIAAALVDLVKGAGNVGVFGAAARQPTPWQTIGRWEIGGGD